MNAFIKHQDGGLGINLDGCPKELNEVTCPHCTRDNALWNISEAIRLTDGPGLDRANDVSKIVASLKEAHALLSAVTFRKATR